MTFEDKTTVGNNTRGNNTRRGRAAKVASWGDQCRRLTDSVSVLVGADNGLYPSGNSLVVEGTGETVIIDPSVSVVARGGAHLPIDAVINSHGHEDHVAGNGLFDTARVHIHHDDLRAAQHLDGLMEIYGFEGQARDDFAKVCLEEFSYAPRPDAEGFGDGHRWDLGGVSIEAVHLPGHTFGHSGFRIDDGVFFLSDIDLTGFGPYYGDAWSSLEQFEASLRQVRDEEADFYVTFHHKGVIEGRETFITMVDDFAAAAAFAIVACFSSLNLANRESISSSAGEELCPKAPLFIASTSV